eukprot:TRINITY_DN5026_c0_g1_i1.p1 TRINITY_DN5026_c0_g1~~TRINITY_DN5026_c0_g1_i1.p1  ORF type:complete len:368 (-),score=69.26 TRINITY_DN5026_c0_g1_i1:71-1174(-)
MFAHFFHHGRHSNVLLLRENTKIRCLQHITRYHRSKSAAQDIPMANLNEIDAFQMIKAITPPLESGRHKGQAGKIAVIGGCREYTGAPYFAAISALKIGADLSHVFCTQDAATVIKSYSPELIVHPVLHESYNINNDEKDSVRGKVVADISKWIERFDSIVVGPGLGRDPFLMDCITEVIQLAKQQCIPIVVDGDGLYLVTNNPDLVVGYPLAILTPNINEYKRLRQRIMDTNISHNEDASDELRLLAERMGGLTILQKGKSDLVSDGYTVLAVNLYGSPRRCGGQGDILSGSVAVFCSWAVQREKFISEAEESRIPSNSMLLGATAGSVLLRKAAAIAFQEHKRSTVTTDIIAVLGKCVESICPAE